MLPNKNRKWLCRKSDSPHVHMYVCTCVCVPMSVSVHMCLCVCVWVSLEKSVNLECTHVSIDISSGLHCSGSQGFILLFLSSHGKKKKNASCSLEAHPVVENFSFVYSKCSSTVLLPAVFCSLCQWCAYLVFKLLLALIIWVTVSYSSNHSSVSPQNSLLYLHKAELPGFLLSMKIMTQWASLSLKILKTS